MSSYRCMKKSHEYVMVDPLRRDFLVKVMMACPKNGIVKSRCLQPVVDDQQENSDQSVCCKVE